MAKWEEVSISEARASLGELASQVYYQGGAVMLTKNGKAIAAIVQPEVALQLGEKAQRYRQALETLRFERLSKAQSPMPTTVEEETKAEEARKVAGRKALEALEVIRSSGIGSEMSEDEWEEFVAREVEAVRRELAPVGHVQEPLAI